MERRALAELITRELEAMLERYRAGVDRHDIGQRKRDVMARQIPNIEKALERRRQWIATL